MSDYVSIFILLQLVLLVPSFYLYRWALMRLRFTAIKTWTYVLTFLFPVIFIGIFLIINSEYIYPTIRSKKFDSKVWKSDARNRYRMVKDIMVNGLLIGKTKQETITLLGEDSENGPCNDCIGYSTNDPDQGFSIDHEVLEIEFDDLHRVIATRINLW